MALKRIDKTGLKAYFKTLKQPIIELKTRPGAEFKVLREMVMKVSTSLDITPCSPLKIPLTFGGRNLSVSCWFLAWSILQC
jgi:hypothetical protein